MELGNMMFGNSRGEVSVPRTASFEGPWEELCEGINISYRGYAEQKGHPLENAAGEIETPVFVIRAYDWDADCDCGADDRMNAWLTANPHGLDCYHTELHARLKSWEDRSGYTATKAVAFETDESPMPGMECEAEDVAPGVRVMSFTPRSDAAMDAYRAMSARRRKVEEALFDELCARHKVDRRFGCAVHCTCGRNQRADEMWVAMGGHTDACRFVQPNFLYKPTSFRINWYKYPFRDSYMSPGISAKEWQKIVRHCIESAADA